MFRSEKRNNGAFYTSQDIAKYLVNRVAVKNSDVILEPSFGDGAFIDAIIDSFKKKKILKNNIYGVEIQKEPIKKYANSDFIDQSKIFNCDFLAKEPFPIDLIIGNPPYIGLNRIQKEQKARAYHILDLFDFKMQSSGSLWLPFILHSCSFLKKGGTIAFVLPFEITYVKYAKQLWKYLSERFEKLFIIRIYEDIFPDVDVETVLFIAKGFGGKTNFINYEIYNKKQSLCEKKPYRIINVPVESILNGDRPFVIKMLKDEYINIINKLKEQAITIPIKEVCKFKIGYVCADKHFFHPTNEVIVKYKIKKQDLLPTISNSKVLKGNVGLTIDKSIIDTKLFLPQGNMSEATRRYIEYGVKQNIDRKYKCSQRKPWYITPGLEVPDVILTVFGDIPRLYVNKGRYLASNSLLCGYIKNKANINKLVASWYNIFTLLSTELRIHSLGGGVLVFIPGETDTIDVINPDILENISSEQLMEIDKHLKNGDLESAYKLGDKLILKKIGLQESEIDKLHKAYRELKEWRNSRLRKVKGENVNET